jgi:molybdenum cofactor synthesis domain-containing protein
VVKTAGILIVGDEVLSGEVRDENGPFLISRLAAFGSRVVRVSVVADAIDEIAGGLNALRAVADAVVVSGGIGPTHDDLTRPAVAKAVGVPLELHPQARDQVSLWYGDRATEAERRMAWLPRGSRVLRGPRTNTLGFAVAGVYVLPGVPSLLRDLVEGLSAEFAGPSLHREEVHTDLREGEIAEDLTRIQSVSLDVAIGSYPTLDASGRWRTRIVVRSADGDRASVVAETIRSAFERLSGPR